MKEMILKRRDLLIVLIMILFLVGSVGHAVSATRDLMLFLTPIFLLSTGLLVLLPEILERNFKTLVWCGVIYLITFSLEALGVATGAVFGEYHYGSTLGPELFEVPVVIGFNWVIVIIASAELVMLFTRKRYLVAPLTGLAAMLFDIILEPVAIELDYWHWVGESIPLQNYAAWFVIAGIMGFTYPGFMAGKGRKMLIVYLLLQTLLFLFLRLTVVKG
ncbi:MAG: carotenoid biosynthesis protein [Thermoplasmatota archaeon]